MKKAVIEIELDRENRVYFPGETVTGKAFLHQELAQEDHLKSCEGLYLNYSSVAEAKWTERDNDGQKDSKVLEFSSETTFQSLSRTLCGNSYQTGKLSTTGSTEGANYQGEMLNFDNYPGSGVIHIPCSESDKSNLKLIVSALDAEAKIDIPKLINSAESDSELPYQTFYLSTSVGNMTKGPVKLSAEFVPYKSVFPSETGRQDDDCEPYCLVLKVHQLKGVKPGSKNVQVKVRRAELVPAESPLLSSKKSVFPFSLTLREDTPGSANFKCKGSDLISGVTHRMKVYCEGQGGKSCSMPSCSLIFTVLPNRPLPRPQLLSPYRMETGDQPLMRFGCCATGKMVVSIILCMGRLVYAPGEVIDLTGSTVSNNSKEDQNMQVVLRTFVEMSGTEPNISNKNNTKKNVEEHCQVLFEDVIPSQKDVIITNLPTYNWIRLPPVPPSYSGQHLSADKQSREISCIRWTYTIEIRLPYYGGNGFNCRSPMLVAAAPPFTQELNEHRNVSQSNPELTDQWSIFNHAVSSQQNACKSAPTLTSPDDFQGRIVTAKGAAVSRAVWMMVDEDVGDKDNDDATTNTTGRGEEQQKAWILKNRNNAQDLATWIEGNDGSKTTTDELDRLFYRPLCPVYAGPSFDRSRPLEGPSK